ncbi:hypothetical protein MIND_00026600 [Mycena indigotica]|uniref:Uncharacterized protein n=1 Tax=Mycena indigotica TaxID=2126181 RepID=A0A8H6WHI7_9AGAR|nr:uncharacterized protein MIND_00026600 [Mycena indigotica]KAF7315123.1 hypothetical protein MIND_00026600 [Mycena indigotica]
MSVLVASPPSSPQRARSRALSLALAAASKPAPLLDVPTELGLAILELALTHTPLRTLASLSRAFNTLIAAILYRQVILDTPQKLALFARTIRGKTPDFVESHVKTLAVTIEHWRFTPASNMDLETIIAVCSGVRILSLPRPRILALSRHSRILPSELTLQSFDLSSVESCSGGTLQMAHSLSHLRIAEPGDLWNSPLSILAFFGGVPHLSHLALARRMDANTDNDVVFVDEVQAILESRPRLKMLVVRIFPAYFPLYCGQGMESSSIWTALEVVAESDPRLMLVAAGQDTSKLSWAHLPGDDFWEDSMKKWEARSPPPK